jgi:hypothetical protein
MHVLHHPATLIPALLYDEGLYLFACLIAKYKLNPLIIYLHFCKPIGIIVAPFGGFGNKAHFFQITSQRPDDNVGNPFFSKYSIK